MNGIVETLQRHKARLLSLPGCTGVAIGHKEIRGEATDRMAIVVFVKKKQQGMADDDLVPPTLDGMPTDVVEKTFGFKLTQIDPFERFSKLFSGISITPYRVASTAWGTLGCIILTTGNRHVVGGYYLLTCQHVLKYADPENPHSLSSKIIQPGAAGLNPPDEYWCGNYVYGVDDRENDCAIATIDYTRTWENYVPDPSGREPLRPLGGVDEARVGDAVYKYGATSGTTHGTVKYIHYDSRDQPIDNAIYIVSTDKETPWVVQGDSGSIVIREIDNFVLGLNFAVDDKAEHPAGYAYDMRLQMANFGGIVSLA